MDEIYFRTDVNEIIATGHLMRCLSIANAAADKGLNPVFILSDRNGKETVESKGYETCILNSKWDDPESEIDDLTDLIQKREIVCLILDSYSVTDRYIREISEFTRVFYIDDVGKTACPMAAIICYANYYSRFDYDQRYADTNTKLLLGCDYVPLRKEFRGLPKKRIESSVRNILLLSGGSDPCHVLSRLLNSLNDGNGIRIEAICGRFDDEYSRLSDQYGNFANIRIHQAVDDMVEYMKQADLAISAGGTTLYELSACGTPTITYSFADNQLDNVRQFERDGLMPYLGDARYVDITARLRQIMSEFSSMENRQTVSANLQRLVDGKGAERIVEEIIIYSKRETDDTV